MRRNLEARDLLAGLETGLRILVVGPRGEARLVERYLSGLLERRHFDVVTAQSGAAAAHRLERQEFDVCLFDARLGEGPLARLLAAAGGGRRPPVVLLTAGEDVEATVRALERGVTDFLLRGTLTPEVLLRAIHYAAERGRLERRLVRTSGLDPFVAGSIHDLNNLLTTLLGYSELLRERAATLGDAEAIECCQELSRAALRSRELVEELLERHRRLALTEALNLGKVIGRLRPALEKAVGPRIDLTLDLASETPWVRLTASEAERILTNLVSNAREAMADVGSIRISTRTAVVAPGSRGALRPGRYACVEVRDDGPGMPLEVRQRVFEAFFTTKEGPGRGLGLAGVEAIVRAAMGEVRLESAPGEGTTVEVWLPASGGPRHDG